MKKIFLLALLAMSLVVKSQTEVTTKPIKTVASNTDAIYGFNPTDSSIWVMQAPQAFPFSFASPYIYMRSNTNKLVLGASTTTGDYRLSVIGNQYMSGYLDIANSIRFWSGSGYNHYIKPVGSNLTFHDNSGTYTLTQLAASGGSTYTYGNMLQLVGDEVRLGGTANSTTTLNVGDYVFGIADGTYNLFSASSNATTLYNHLNLTLLSGDYFFAGNTKFELYQNGTNRTIFRDRGTTPVGLVYYAYYGSNVTSTNNENALVQYKLLKDYVAANGGGGGLDTTTIPDPTSTVSVLLSLDDSADVNNPKGLFLAPLERDSVYNTGNIVAGTGITVGQVHEYMFYNGSSAINITANPQIALGVGIVEITIIGGSDSNTLTLDDGTGLQLEGGASCVLGAGDVIKLLYNYQLNLYVEMSRSNN
jgi:hypothetical protein